MAFTVKILERGSDVTVAAHPNPWNIFEDISSGYTGTSCTVTYASANHKWTAAGNAASTTMYWQKSSATAYTLNHKFFFRADVKPLSSGLTKIELEVDGATSGAIVFTGTGVINSPTSGTTYSLYGRVTLTGLVGNLKPRIKVTDPTSCNGKSVEITNWLAIDMTTDLGAGTEIAAADFQAWLVWRSAGWSWLDWYGRTVSLVFYATDPYYTLVRITSHTFETGDMIGEVDVGGVPIDADYSAVVKIDANWIATTGGMGTRAYHKVDRTNRVLTGTLNVNLRTDIDSEATFDMLGDATWSAKLGMTVMLYDGTTLLFLGKITDISIERYLGTSSWKSSCTVKTLSQMVSRRFFLFSLVNWSGYTGAAAVKAATAQLTQFGILYGVCETGVANVGEIDQDLSDNAAVFLNTVASASGMKWWIDTDRKLHFRSPLYTPAAAAHALVDGNGYTSYRRVVYSQSTQDYRTQQVVIGGYDDATGARIEDWHDLVLNLGITRPISGDTEACSSEYSAFLSNGSIDTHTDAFSLADTNLKIYGAQVPCQLSFESDSLDWRPNTKLQVNLAYLGMTGSTYFNIDSVTLSDLNGLNVVAQVTASQRDPSNYAATPNAGPTAFLSDLQSLAQNSAGAIKQEAGTFPTAPTVQGTGTAGTYTYTKQDGYYVRLGNMVFINIRILLASVSGSPTGTIRINGLPYLACALPDQQFLHANASSISWGTSATQLQLLITPSDTYGLLYGGRNNATIIASDASTLSASDDIRIQGWYQISP